MAFVRIPVPIPARRDGNSYTVRFRDFPSSRADILAVRTDGGLPPSTPADDRRGKPVGRHGGAEKNRRCDARVLCAR